MTAAKEAYNWILSIIGSCNNDFHFDGADKLIELFKEMFSDQDALYTELKMARTSHWNAIHGILV